MDVAAPDAAPAETVKCATPEGKAKRKAKAKAKAKSKAKAKAKAKPRAKAKVAGLKREKTGTENGHAKRTRHDGDVQLAPVAHGDDISAVMDAATVMQNFLASADFNLKRQNVSRFVTTARRKTNVEAIRAVEELRELVDSGVALAHEKTGDDTPPARMGNETGADGGERDPHEAERIERVRLARVKTQDELGRREARFRLENTAGKIHTFVDFLQNHQNPHADGTLLDAPAGAAPDDAPAADTESDVLLQRRLAYLAYVANNRVPYYDGLYRHTQTPVATNDAPDDAAAAEPSWDYVEEITIDHVREMLLPPFGRYGACVLDDMCVRASIEHHVAQEPGRSYLTPDELERARHTDAELPERRMCYLCLVSCVADEQHEAQADRRNRSVDLPFRVAFGRPCGYRLSAMLHSTTGTSDGLAWPFRRYCVADYVPTVRRVTLRDGCEVGAHDDAGAAAATTELELATFEERADVFFRMGSSIDPPVVPATRPYLAAVRSGKSLTTVMLLRRYFKKFVDVNEVHALVSVRRKRTLARRGAATAAILPKDREALVASLRDRAERGAVRLVERASTVRHANTDDRLAFRSLRASARRVRARTHAVYTRYVHVRSRALDAALDPVRDAATHSFVLALRHRLEHALTRRALLENLVARRRVPKKPASARQFADARAVDSRANLLRALAHLGAFVDAHASLCAWLRAQITGADADGATLTARLSDACVARAFAAGALRMPHAALRFHPYDMCDHVERVRYVAQPLPHEHVHARLGTCATVFCDFEATRTWIVDSARYWGDDGFGTWLWTQLRGFPHWTPPWPGAPTPAAARAALGTLLCGAGARVVERHSVLVALLVRVNVALALVAKCADDDDAGARALAYHAWVFVLEHLDLALFVSDTGVVSDAELRRTDEPNFVKHARVRASEDAGDAALSAYLVHYPHGGRALCEETLPYTAPLYSSASFVCDLNTRNMTWFYLMTKTMPCVCQVRKFGSMHRRACDENRAFLKWSVLCLKATMLGAYRHARMLPTFAAAVRVHKHVRFPATERHVRSFMERNRDVTLYALREYATVQIALNPPLRHLIDKHYGHWAAFETHVHNVCNITRGWLARHGTTRGLNKFLELRVSNPRNVFRKRHADFAVYALRQFSACNIARARKERGRVRAARDARTALVAPDTRALMRRYVSTLVPGEPIDLRWFSEMCVSDNGVRVVEHVYEMFLGRRPEGEVQQAMRQYLSDVDYELVNYAFHLLRTHYGTRVTRLDGAMREAQERAVRRRWHVAAAGQYLPTTTYTVGISPCCNQVRTFVVQDWGAYFYGLYRVFWDRNLHGYYCAGAAPKNSTSRRSRDTRAPTAAHDAAATTTLRREQRSRYALACETVPVVRVDVRGLVLEHDSGGTGEHEATQRLTLCPRCGVFTEFSTAMWGPHGFTCGECDAAERAAVATHACVGCGALRPPDTVQRPWQTFRALDDGAGGTLRVRTFAACPLCARDAFEQLSGAIARTDAPTILTHADSSNTKDMVHLRARVTRTERLARDGRFAALVRRLAAEAAQRALFVEDRALVDAWRRGAARRVN